MTYEDALERLKERQMARVRIALDLSRVVVESSSLTAHLKVVERAHDAASGDAGTFRMLTGWGPTEGLQLVLDREIDLWTALHQTLTRTIGLDDEAYADVALDVQDDLATITRLLALEADALANPSPRYVQARLAALPRPRRH